MLLGGPRRLLALTGVYAGAMLAGNVLIYRSIMNEISLGAFADGSLAVTLMIQSGLFLLGGCGAIKKAIHRDFTSDMITSHRNSAMTGQIAVVGYLTGSTLTVLSLSVVNLVAMTLLAMIGGHPPYGPLVIFGMLGCLTLFLWMMAILAGLSSRGAFSIAGVVAVFALFANVQSLVMIHPGLSLILSYAPIYTLMRAGPSTTLDLSVLVSMAAQITLALILFLAAARKFQRDDVAAFSPPLANLLLAVVALVTAVGLRFYGDSLMTLLRAESERSAQVVTSLASLSLLAMLPSAVAARRSAQWQKRKAIDPQYQEPMPRHWIEAPLLSTLIVFFILLVVAGNRIYDEFEFNRIHRHLLLATVLAFVLSLLPMAGMMRFGYSITQRVGIVGALLLALLWAGPPLVDLALEAMLHRAHSEPKSWVFGASPIGAWIIIFGDVNAPLWPGIAIQGAISLVLMALPRMAGR